MFEEGDCIAMQEIPMTNKGVSEVVGYLLVFSIVVTIVSVIYVSGMPVVEQTKETSAITSMETVFLTLQGNIKKVAVGQSPVRTMKLNLVKGTMSAHENAGTIIIDKDASPVTIPFGNIEYTLGTRKLVYENGAVIESTPGGSIIVSEPPIFFTNDSGNAHVFISLINVSGTFSAGGGVAEMQMRHENTTVSVYQGVTVNNISITGSYNDAWSRFITDTFGGFPISSCNLTLVTHNVTVS